MTMFSSTASPGQRWKMFLPGAASAQCDAFPDTLIHEVSRSRGGYDRAACRGPASCGHIG